MMSFLPDIFGASPQSPTSHAPTFFAAQLRFLYEWKVSALHDRSGSSKCFNPSEYSSTHQSIVFQCGIAPRHSALNKTLDSNYGITVSKRLLNGKHMMLYVPLCHGY